MMMVRPCFRSCRKTLGGPFEAKQHPPIFGNANVRKPLTLWRQPAKLHQGKAYWFRVGIRGTIIDGCTGGQIRIGCCVAINAWYRLSSIGKSGFATNAYARRMRIYLGGSKNRISLCCKRPSFLVSHSQTVKTFHPSFLNFL